MKLEVTLGTRRVLDRSKAERSGYIRLSIRARIESAKLTAPQY